MSTSMGVANPKFSKSGRKSKKTKHCTIPKKILATEKKSKKGLLSKETDLIRITVANKITKMSMQYGHQDQVWGKIFFSDISRKEKDEG